MGFWIYFWIYTFSMVIIWGFFTIAKIHSLKFKNYQPKIVYLTKIINIVIIILTILWYIFIFVYSWWKNTYTLENINKKKTNIESKIDNFSDISEKDDLLPSDVWDDYY
jgi:hypothetical protein